MMRFSSPLAVIPPIKLVHGKVVQTSSSTYHEVSAPVPASITVEVVPPVQTITSSSAATVTATVRDGSNQPIAGVLLSGSTIPSTLGTASLLTATNAAGQVIGTWTAGSVAGSGLLRANSGSLSGTAPITLNNTVPTLTSLSPMTVTMGGSSFTLTVTGSNFVNGSLIQWNGAPRSTIFISDTRLQTPINSTSLTTTGTVSVTAYNSAPGGGESNALTVTIVTAKKLVYLPLIERHAAVSHTAPLLQVFSWMHKLVFERWQ